MQQTKPATCSSAILADDYWQQIEADTQMLIDENRIRFIETEQGDIAICDHTSTSYAIDPRSFYQKMGLR